MKNKILFPLLCIGLSSQVFAATMSVKSGYALRDGSWYQGGEFTLNDTGFNLNSYSDDTKDGNSFQTFCIEYNELVNSGVEINVETSFAAKNGGISAGTTGVGTIGVTGSFDPISLGTSYLYSQFASGSLGIYDYTPGSGREQSAKDLQTAIWVLENEFDGFAAANGTTADAYLATPYLNLLIVEFGTLAAAMVDANYVDNEYDVYAVNVTLADGTKRQDQLWYGDPSLIQGVPDTGSALFLLGMSLTGIGFFQKRFKKQ